MATKEQRDDILYTTSDMFMVDAYNKATGRGEAFSEENPYYRQMQYAKNRTDLQRMRSAAIEWEANQQNYQQQLADQRALRDEERAYNTPAAQAARLRAAGINPDIGEGGGISASGSSGSAPSVPGMAPTDMDTLSTPMETAQTVFQGMQSAGSLISSVGGFITSSMQFAKDAASFGSFLTQQKSAASISESQAEQAQMATADMKFNQMAGLATSLPEGLDVNDDKALSSHLSALGYDDTYMPGVRAIQKSPELQKKYNDSLVAAREAREINLRASEAYVRESVSSVYATKALQRNSELAKAAFDHAFAMRAYTEEEGDLAGKTQLAKNTEQFGVALLQNQKTDFAFNAYVKSIEAIAVKSRELTAKVQQLKSETLALEAAPGVPSPEHRSLWAQNKGLIRAYENQILELHLVGSEQSAQLINTLQGISYKQSVNDAVRPGDIPASPGWTWRDLTDLNYMGLMFDNFVENPGEASKQAQGFLQTILSLGGKALTKGSSITIQR